ncbi:MFS transporter [Rhizorhabdus dicambivorans]|uniref:MFS transporter n=1 Tax=Rhizorhabdus dicambivorans TaxID=1850238 RepID=A0A2A4FVJ8_9SPHN|nr:MFS transporter [Rhizorhabdus dicambivorans]ATE63678.1 MFS transporter [Rhizorhabdus dicambivorans]PCE42806.1 MFS transporter [Rhizorhabdus dicambivorans]
MGQDGTVAVLPSSSRLVSAAPPAESTARYGWYVLGILTFVNLISATDRFLMGVIMVPLKTDLQLSDTSLGLLQGLAFALLYCLAGIPLGRIADTYSRRLLLAAGCLGWTVATGACAFADSFESLFAARLIVGLGEASLMPAAISLIGAYIARDRLGTATSIFMMGATGGKAVAFIGGGALLSFLTIQGGMTLLGHEFRPWQALFLAAALPGIPAALILLTVREPARPGKPMAAAKAMRELWGHIRRHRAAVFGFFVAGTCTILNAHLFAAWAPSFFVRRYGLGVGEAAMIVGVVVVAIGPVGGITAGVIADRLLRRGVETAPLRVMLGAFLLAIPGAILMVAADSLWLAMMGYAIAQIMVLAGGPQSYSGIQMLTPLRHRGIMSATYLAVTTLAAMGVGPASIGLFSDNVWTDPATGLGYSIMTVLVIFTLIGLGGLVMATSRFAGTARAAHDVNNAEAAGA